MNESSNRLEDTLGKNDGIKPVKFVAVENVTMTSRQIAILTFIASMLLWKRSRSIAGRNAETMFHAVKIARSEPCCRQRSIEFQPKDSWRNLLIQDFGGIDVGFCSRLNQPGVKTAGAAQGLQDGRSSVNVADVNDLSTAAVQCDVPFAVAELRRDFTADRFVAEVDLCMLDHLSSTVTMCWQDGHLKSLAINRIEGFCGESHRLKTSVERIELIPWRHYLARGTATTLIVLYEENQNDFVQ